jgi:hypothetical protein
VSTNVAVSTAASLQVDAPVVTAKANTANTASAATEEVDAPAVTEKKTTTNNASAKHKEQIQRSIGKTIQHLVCSDNTKISAALDALDLDLDEDKRKAKALSQPEFASCLFN